MASKRAHVVAAGQTRSHTCHWPGCVAQCPPAMWGCKRHWFTVPKPLRDRLWRAYAVGQEERLDPSKDYVKAAREIERWCLAYIREREEKATRQGALDLPAKVS